jgi:serine/threonine protein phosphatase PrpC
MNLFERIRSLLSPTPSSTPPRRPSDEAMTIPMTSQQLARALAGEGRRHVGLGTGLGENAEQTALFTVIGNSDGHNVLPDFSLIGVADGVAKNDRGPKASDLAMKAFSEYMIRNAVLDLLALDSTGDTAPIQDAVVSGFKAAQKAVAQYHADPSLSMTAGIMFSEIVILGHTGTTRAYIIDRHHVEQITRDSVLDAAANGNQARKVDTAVNASGVASFGKDLEVSIFSRPVPRGGYILLSSSGLNSLMEGNNVLNAFIELEDPQAVSDRLISRAEEEGKSQDLSLVILYFPPDFGSWR